MTYETPTLYFVGSTPNVVLGIGPPGWDGMQPMDEMAQLEAEW